MEKLNDIVISASAGTTAMTLCSYGVSIATKDNCSEPEHLATLIDRIIPSSTNKNSLLAGWATHYTIGVVFFAIYKKLWQRGTIKKNVGNAIILGCLSGLIGIGMWNAILKIHPAPPNVKRSTYFIQLIPAHVIFAVLASMTSKLLVDRSSVKKLTY